MPVQRVTDNPNPKAATFILDGDVLQDLGRVIMPRNDKIVQYSPLAKFFFEDLLQKGRGTDVMRIDFTHENGEDRVTLIRKFAEWKEGEIDKVHTYLNRLESRGTPLLYAQTLKRDYTPVSRYKAPEGSVLTSVQQTFDRAVSPFLSLHGGDMELSSLSIEPDGEVKASVALMGSCAGCGSAEVATLNNAIERVNKALQTLADKHPANKDLKSLHMKEIQTVNTTGGFIMSRPGATDPSPS